VIVEVKLSDLPRHSPLPQPLNAADISHGWNNLQLSTVNLLTDVTQEKVEYRNPNPKTISKLEIQMTKSKNAVFVRVFELRIWDLFRLPSAGPDKVGAGGNFDIRISDFTI